MAALLLPALAQTKEKARRISCLSNLKQVTMAMHLFVTDNEHHPRRLPLAEGGSRSRQRVYYSFAALQTDLEAVKIPTKRWATLRWVTRVRTR